jgi:hypothetical protein
MSWSGRCSLAFEAIEAHRAMITYISISSFCNIPGRGSLIARGLQVLNSLPTWDIAWCASHGQEVQKRFGVGQFQGCVEGAPELDAALVVAISQQAHASYGMHFQPVHQFERHCPLGPPALSFDAL